MSNRLDEPSEQALQRLGVSTYAIAVRRIILERPALDDLIGVPLGPQPVEVVRPADLVHLTFSFENMEFAAAGNAQTPPLLARRTKNRPAFLIVDFHAQHAIEHALFEVAPGYPVKAPPKPLQLGQGTPAPQDPDEGKPGYDLSTAAGLASLPHPPLWASLAGSTRLAFKVTTETLLYSEEGLIAAIARARSQRRAARSATRAQAPSLQVGRRLRERSDRHHATARRRERAFLPQPARPPGRRVAPRCHGRVRGADRARADAGDGAHARVPVRTRLGPRRSDERERRQQARCRRRHRGHRRVRAVRGAPAAPCRTDREPDEHRAPVAPPDLAQRERRVRAQPHPGGAQRPLRVVAHPARCARARARRQARARRRGEADRRRAHP